MTVTKVVAVAAVADRHQRRGRRRRTVEERERFTRLIVANHARTGSERIVTWSSAGSMLSTRHPGANPPRISACVTRRGPHPGGSSSLKQSMK